MTVHTCLDGTTTCSNDNKFCSLATVQHTATNNINTILTTCPKHHGTITR